MRMRTCMVFQCVFALCTGLCFASSAPDWVATFGQSSQFPGSTYITGFGMSAADKKMAQNDKLAQAQGFAQSNLTAAIQIHISSENISNMIEASTNGKGTLINDVKSSIVSRTNLNIEGIHYEVFSENGKGDPVYVLAWLEKSTAIAHYKKRFNDGVAQLAIVYKQADSLLNKKDITAARQVFLDCDKRCSELEEMLLILGYLGASPIDQQQMNVLLAAKNASGQLWTKAAETMEEAAEQIAVKIAEQKLAAGTVQINAPMLEDTYLYSQFSGQFRTILERMIAKTTSLTPLAAGDLDFTPQSAHITAYTGAANGAAYVISGSYFVQGDSLHMYLRVLNVVKNTVCATAEAIMNISATKGLELKPRNFMQAMEDKHVFGNNEIVNSGLSLETWTNRGAESIMLEGGDKVVVFVRVNKPSYLRFVYHLANGARVFPDKLYRNYYIDESKVNKVIALPDTFEVTPPFGSETMQMFASTQKFPDVALTKKVIDGEDYDVIDDDLPAFTSKTRGLKKLEPKQGTAASVEIAEKRISVTSVVK